VAQALDWEDFRDHLATADKEGRRMWLYPKKPRGRFYQARTYFSYLLLAIMFAGPFIRINGNPLLMINIVDRKFVVLGQIFWPQDMIHLRGGDAALFLTGIIVFTAALAGSGAAGPARKPCSWNGIPKIEYSSKATPAATRPGQGPWTGQAVPKVLKHGDLLRPLVCDRQHAARLHHRQRGALSDRHGQPR
jgi:hypothetical protein